MVDRVVGREVVVMDNSGVDLLEILVMQVGVAAHTKMYQTRMFRVVLFLFVVLLSEMVLFIVVY